VTGNDLVDSIAEVVERLDVVRTAFSRVVLSTTLSTNAIIEGKHP
jgi:N-methylhydantoinase A/oxoprolinase/acetone carboxylase beta subunit